MATGTSRSDAGAADDPGDGRAAQAAAAVRLLRLRAMERVGMQTYLRVNKEVFPVYGDEVRGWSPRADDFRGITTKSPYVYSSLEELFFALVNLCAAPRGEA